MVAPATRSRSTTGTSEKWKEDLPKDTFRADIWKSVDPESRRGRPGLDYAVPVRPPTLAHMPQGRPASGPGQYIGDATVDRLRIAGLLITRLLPPFLACGCGGSLMGSLRLPGNLFQPAHPAQMGANCCEDWPD
jgi:hypothetical protein